MVFCSASSAKAPTTLLHSWTLNSLPLTRLKPLPTDIFMGSCNRIRERGYSIILAKEIIIIIIIKSIWELQEKILWMLASKLFRSLSPLFPTLFAVAFVEMEWINVVFFSCTKCCFLILFYFLLVFFTNNYGKSSITDGEQKLPFDRKLWKVSLTVRKKIFIFIF